MPATHSSILALDVGEKRIGIALASTVARLAQPYTTLKNDEYFSDELSKLISKHGVKTIVVGMPRNLAGEDTPQTTYVRRFIDVLRSNLPAEYVWQDEAATSLKAEAELKGRRKGYTKEDIDALSAAYILEDYLGGISN